MKDKPIDFQSYKQGYHEEDTCFKCDICGATFRKGEIFEMDGHFYEASLAIKEHVDHVHGSRFDSFVALDKKQNSLTDVQKQLMIMIHNGKSDKEIAALTNTSASTIRHQRFMFKERAKQARCYLALYELMMEGNENSEFIEYHENAKMKDDRFIATKKEEEDTLQTMFSSLNPLKLKQFPAKDKKKLMVLKAICETMDRDKEYSEVELNQLLKAIYDDYVAIRRALIEYGFMERTRDCTKYWVSR